MKRSKWLWLTGGVLGMAGLVFVAVQEPPLDVDVATVERGTLVVTVDNDGRTKVKERYTVYAPVAGQLQRIGLEPGDPITADQTVLAVIDPLEAQLLDDRSRAEAEARVNSAAASVERVRAQLRQTIERLAQSRSDFNRIKGLFDNGLAPRENLERAQRELAALQEEQRAGTAAVTVAEYDLELAKAGLARARQDVEFKNAESRRMTVVAPINGRVFRVLRKSAGTVSLGEALLELGDPTSLEIVADYLSSDAVKVKPGARVIVRGWGGADPLTGNVRLIEPSGFTKISALGVEEQRVNVIVDFVDPPELRKSLGDGFRVELEIVIWEASNVLRVATGALFRQGEGWHAFVIEDGVARLRAVEIGQRTGLEAEVKSGLEPGDRVILYPGDAVAEGRRVRPR